MDSDLTLSVEAVRHFNRFYTKTIGVLPEGHLDSGYSLAEVRVLFELSRRGEATAAEIAGDLDLDAGYLSRIVRRFTGGGLVTRRSSASDGRRSHLKLTKKGRSTFASLNRRADSGVATLMSRLSERDRSRARSAMKTIEDLLTGVSEVSSGVVLRPHRTGDIGWVVERHGEIYFQEYGWDERFEALVARIAGEFVENFVPERERCWIAELNGERAGSVFLVKKSERVAQLRLLLVEPAARGFGIGSRLVTECETFARGAGYRKIVLWTNSVLVEARRIYEKAGYRVIDREPHESFGHKLVAETWELNLA